MDHTLHLKTKGQKKRHFPEHLPPHELPDQSQGVCAIPLVQVYSSDSNQRKIGFVPAQLYSVVTVLQLEHINENSAFLVINTKV